MHTYTYIHIPQEGQKIRPRALVRTNKRQSTGENAERRNGEKQKNSKKKNEEKEQRLPHSLITGRKDEMKATLNGRKKKKGGGGDGGAAAATHATIQVDGREATQLDRGNNKQLDKRRSMRNENFDSTTCTGRGVYGTS